MEALVKCRCSQCPKVHPGKTSTEAIIEELRRRGAPSALVALCMVHAMLHALFTYCVMGQPGASVLLGASRPSPGPHAAGSAWHTGGGIVAMAELAETHQMQANELHRSMLSLPNASLPGGVQVPTVPVTVPTAGPRPSLHWQTEAWGADRKGCLRDHAKSQFVEVMKALSSLTDACGQ